MHMIMIRAPSDDRLGGRPPLRFPSLLGPIVGHSLAHFHFYVEGGVKYTVLLMP
eukprot:SAG11_NODE_22099_length_412_cov_0.990415_1_plen_54_part_00